MELVLEQLDIGSLRGLVSPIIDMKDEDLDSATEIELTIDQAQLYRTVAARLNYLSIDRADIKFACNGASRVMSRSK